MEKPIKQALLRLPIQVADIKIEPSKNPTMLTWLVLYDNLDLRIKDECTETGTTHTYSPIKSNHTKLIWQKALQQIDIEGSNHNDKRYNKPFEDDGAYAD